MILPQVFGGFTVMLTATGETPYGVSVRTPSFAVYVPGWVTMSTWALTVTVTVADAPAASDTCVPLSDSHGTSVTAPQSAKPGSTSEVATGGVNRPPALPPI